MKILRKKQVPYMLWGYNCQGNTAELRLTKKDVEQLTHSLECGVDLLKADSPDALRTYQKSIKRET